MSVKDSIIYKKIESLSDIREVVELQSDIWGQDVVSPLPQLVASIHHGGVIIGSFFNDKLVGFCYGFAGIKGKEQYLVSHMTGIRQEFQNVGIGYQLKLKQREWALANGYEKIIWTYDPLEVRNGFFNLCKLGAYSKIYHPSYYGDMPDKLNKGLPSDRLLIEWDIGSIRVERALKGELPQKDGEYMKLLHIDGEYPGKLEETNFKEKSICLIPVPTEIQEVKRTNLEAAIAWRFALREVLLKALKNGFVITGVRKVSNSAIQYYLLENRMVVELC